MKKLMLVMLSISIRSMAVEKNYAPLQNGAIYPYPAMEVDGVSYKNVRIMQHNSNSVVFVYTDEKAKGFKNKQQSVPTTSLPEDVIHKLGYKTEDERKAEPFLGRLFLTGQVVRVLTNGCIVDCRDPNKDWLKQHRQNILNYREIEDGFYADHPMSERYIRSGGSFGRNIGYEMVKQKPPYDGKEYVTGRCFLSERFVPESADGESLDVEVVLDGVYRDGVTTLKKYATGEKR